MQAAWNSVPHTQTKRDSLLLSKLLNQCSIQIYQIKCTETHTLEIVVGIKMSRVYLQLSAGLFIPQHEGQFSAEASEVHVAHHVRPF